jgi:hypothetical protein
MEEPVNNPLARCIVLLVLGGMILSANAGQVTFDNRLSKCMSIELKKTSTQLNVVLADTVIALHQTVGECGCFSAQANYVSSVDVDGFRYILQEGLIGLINGGERILVLTSDPILVENKPVQVRLSCAPPL